MTAALALARRGAGGSTPNPNVGCLLVKEGHVVARGWTADGGRPHAEALALGMAGAEARGSTAYVTLEPCAHESARGTACADALVAAGIARAVIAMPDPDPRTAGQGAARLEAAGIAVTCDVCRAAAEAELRGFILRHAAARPEISLKLALSLDGRLALPDGRSQWLTGEEARAFGHLERARADAVVVGRGTLETDAPRLDVRLPGWAGRQPARVVVGSGPAPAGYLGVDGPQALIALANAQGWLRLLVEGGGKLAGSLLAQDLVDRLLLFQAPILVGAGRGIEGLVLADLAAAHGRFVEVDSRRLGVDRMIALRRARAGDFPAHCV
jgi:diaminohydroxyphosphoribosylaminopyrimidine deaminase/5-amino-6-(5-phosphoribosylamino)uracil reductase